MVTERNRNQRRQMKDLIHTLHGRAHTVRVPHIPGKISIWSSFSFGSVSSQPQLLKEL